MKKINILKEALAIVSDRSEEKTRQYGDFSEGMRRAAQILSGMRGKEFTEDDMFAAMIALKLSRESYTHKTDNLLDCVAYLGAWNNSIDERNDQQTDSSESK